MSALQFAFGRFQNQPSLSEQHPRDQIVYTGTHDNNTAEGWFLTVSKEEQNRLRSLAQSDETVSETLIRLAQSTDSPLSIIPLQDYIGLGEEARMNVPGQKGKNWS